MIVPRETVNYCQLTEKKKTVKLRDFTSKLTLGRHLVWYSTDFLRWVGLRGKKTRHDTANKILVRLLI